MVPSADKLSYKKKNEAKSAFVPNKASTSLRSEVTFTVPSNDAAFTAVPVGDKFESSASRRPKSSSFTEIVPSPLGEMIPSKRSI